MAAFEVLLHQYCTRPGLGGVPPDDDGLLLERVFRRWAEAERAMGQGRPRQALQWLAEARALDSSTPDPVAAAELLAGETRCWVALDEPREAIGPARAAWERWLGLANGPSADVILPAARALLAVLSSPDPPPKLSDAEVFAAWLEDHLVIEFQRSSGLVLGLLADVHRVDLADEVANDYLGWIERFTPEAGQGLLRARFALRLGDVYDRCDDSARALAVLQDGLQRLDGYADQPEISNLRGQLTFNAGNQHAKLGQLEDALEAFTSAAEIGVGGPVEAALRTRYAVAFTKYQLGREDGLIEELADLACRYEEVLTESTAGGSDLDVRQGLDVVYRLWLKLETARLDPADARAVVRFLHLVFALKEEEGKFCSVTQAMERRPDAAFHSEITVLLERLTSTATGVLVVESVPDAVLLVSLSGSSVAVQLLDRDAAAVVGDLIAEQRLATDRLSNRAIPASSPPSPRHVQACQAMWQALDPELRAHIDGARVLAVVMDSSTDLGELPIEILHDGTTYLGLRKRIVRSPALRDLNLSLSRNLVNARPTGTAIVVRAEDALVHADAETSMAVAAASDLGMTPSVHRAPEPSTLLQDLGAGADLLHYVGHGLADRIGEELPLGPGKRLTARGFEAIGPAPAPFTMLSACLAGRSRQLRTGQEHGFVTALIRTGAPGAIAAAYMVPDHLAAEFTALLYYFAKDALLTDAMLQARQTLADDGYHPAAWGCFVQHGAADLRLGRPHLSEPSTWSEWASRYLASGTEEHLRAAREGLADDTRLPANLAQAVDDDLRALAEHDAAHFAASDEAIVDQLSSTSQAAIVAAMVRSYGELRHATADAADREHKAEVIVAQSRTIERILGDSYLLVAAAVELRKHLLPFGDNKTVLDAAQRRLRWLSADEEPLDGARRALIGEETHV
ncbi:CHAT domain-containing protein [Kribbella sp. NBC_00359]|uniref:CHAT domain-containing protein n=1 Tax=Kribbella sp. NBC_00359 TaxID=2975966 RepID=UPI002E1B98E5